MEGNEELPAQLPLELRKLLSAAAPPLRRSVNQAAVGTGYEPPGGEGLRGAGHALLRRTQKLLDSLLALLVHLGDHHLVVKPATREELRKKSKKWYEANRERKSKYSKQWREDDKQRQAEYHKVWNEDNKEHVAEYSKERYEANKAGVAARAVERGWEAESAIAARGSGGAAARAARAANRRQSNAQR
jgi:hypothetical protein